jgi:hypothetical protein
MPPLSVLARGGYPVPGYTSGTPDLRSVPNPDDWFAQQGAPGTGGAGLPATGAPAGGDTSWWNPADPKGSLDTLFGGQPPSSQTILAHAPQLQAVGIEISPPNAEGVTSKIHIPGVGWTRILEGGVAGGQGTGWNYVPQGSTGPGGLTPMGGGAPGAAGGGSAQALAELQTSPGYQFRLGEGQKALERSAAARGTLLTGGTLKGLTRYGQDYASGEYNNRYNQLMGVTALGQNAAAQQGNANSAYAQNAGDLQTQIGNANAAGTVGGANAWGNAYGGAMNNALQMYYLYQLGQGGGGQGGGGQGGGGWTPPLPRAGAPTTGPWLPGTPIYNP